MIKNEMVQIDRILDKALNEFNISTICISCFKESSWEKIVPIIKEVFKYHVIICSTAESIIPSSTIYFNSKYIIDSNMQNHLKLLSFDIEYSSNDFRIISYIYSLGNNKFNYVKLYRDKFYETKIGSRPLWNKIEPIIADVIKHGATAYPSDNPSYSGAISSLADASANFRTNSLFTIKPTYKLYLEKLVDFIIDEKEFIYIISWNRPEL